MANIIANLRSTTAIASGVILYDYHKHGRFANDGIFKDNKMDLVVPVNESDIPAMVENGREKYAQAKLSYNPAIADPRYEHLKRYENKTGLDVNAYRDRTNGQIIISTAGIEYQHPDGKGDTAQDILWAFRSTSGAESGKNLEDWLSFSRDVAKEYGQIDTLTGHSLGGYISMQGKVILDKEGLLKPDTQLHTFDIPGMTHTLAKELGNKYDVTDADITASLKSENVYSWINTVNSYNSLGALPGNILTATDPAKSEYKEWAVNHLMPKKHVLPEFDKSFAAGQFYAGNNNSHSRGPEYLTYLTAAGVTQRFSPLAAGMILAVPTARHFTGEQVYEVDKNEDMIADINEAMSPKFVPKYIDQPQNIKHYLQLYGLSQEYLREQGGVTKPSPDTQLAALGYKEHETPSVLREYMESIEVKSRKFFSGEDRDANIGELKSAQIQVDMYDHSVQRIKLQNSLPEKDMAQIEQIKESTRIPTEPLERQATQATSNKGAAPLR